MPVISRGIPIVFGVKNPKPIVGAPEGRQRLRMRNTQAAKLFVKTANGIRSFVLKEDGDHWAVALELEQGANYRG